MQPSKYRNCWANYLGDCAEGMSQEHLVSGQPRVGEVPAIRNLPRAARPACDPAAAGWRPVACWLLRGDHKNIFFCLSLKTAQNDTIYMKDFVGGGGEAGDVQPGRRSAPNQPRNGLPRHVPDCRVSAGTGAAGHRAGRALPSLRGFELQKKKFVLQISEFL
jgi:hypothetical protein